MDETEKGRLREHLIELRKFVGKQSRHFAFKTYSKPFLVGWLANVSRELGVEIPLLDRMVISLARARTEDARKG